MDPLYLRKLRQFEVNKGIQNRLNENSTQREANNQQNQVGKPNNPEQAEQAQNTQQQQGVQRQTPDGKPMTNLQSQSERVMKDLRDEMLAPRKQLKMNYLASMERSTYVKKVMNLPRTLPELLIQLQNPELAKDVHNVLMQPLPMPDTQKTNNKTDDKVNQENKNKNNPSAEYTTEEQPYVPDEDFADVLKDTANKDNSANKGVNNGVNNGVSNGVNEGDKK